MKMKTPRIIYDDIEAPALYIAAIHTIVVSANLTETEQEQALRHELAHVEQSNSLYRASVAQKLKLEHEANCYMVSELLQTYLSQTDQALEDINYITFMEQVGLSDKYIPIVEHVVKQAESNGKLENSPIA